MAFTTDHAWTKGSRERLIPTVLGSLNIRSGGRDDGPAMVFWPSLLMTGSMWRHQFQHYAPTHRVILIDPPGIGKSDPLRRTITLDQCSDSLLEILDALGIDTCVLVGNSWGALVAGVFAARHPQRVSAAVAANGTASAPTKLEKLQLSPMLGLLGLHTRTPRWFASITQSTFAGRTARKTKPGFLDELECVLDEDPKSIAVQMKSLLLFRDDTHALLRSIDVPVLVVAGEEDRQFSLATVQDVAETIPGGVFVVLPATGHLSALESPELFNDALDEFLKNIGQAAGRFD